MDLLSCARVRALNDRLRREGLGGRIMTTRGVRALTPEQFARAIALMRAFDDFTHANDPYDEHDFGAFAVDGHSVFFKIDYYDATLTAAAPDPSDETTCVRVLTLMLASEY